MVLLITSLFTFLTIPSFQTNKQKLFSLNVETGNLRNNKGPVVFALFNQKDTFPDEPYKKYYKKMIGKIENHTAWLLLKIYLPENMK